MIIKESQNPPKLKHNCKKMKIYNKTNNATKKDNQKHLNSKPNIQTTNEKRLTNTKHTTIVKNDSL